MSYQLHCKPHGAPWVFLFLRQGSPWEPWSSWRPADTWPAWSSSPPPWVSWCRADCPPPRRLTKSNHKVDPPVSSPPTQLSALRPLVGSGLHHIVRVLGGEVLQHLPQPFPVRPARTFLENFGHIRRNGGAVCVSLSDVRHDCPCCPPVSCLTPLASWPQISRSEPPAWQYVVQVIWTHLDISFFLCISYWYLKDLSLHNNNTIQCMIYTRFNPQDFLLTQLLVCRPGSAMGDPIGDRKSDLLPSKQVEGSCWGKLTRKRRPRSCHWRPRDLRGGRDLSAAVTSPFRVKGKIFFYNLCRWSVKCCVVGSVMTGHQKHWKLILSLLVRLLPSNIGKLRLWRQIHSHWYCRQSRKSGYQSLEDDCDRRVMGVSTKVNVVN